MFLLHSTQNPVGPSVSWLFETDCKQEVLFCSDVLLCIVLFYTCLVVSQYLQLVNIYKSHCAGVCVHFCELVSMCSWR